MEKYLLTLQLALLFGLPFHAYGVLNGKTYSAFRLTAFMFYSIAFGYFAAQVITNL